MDSHGVSSAIFDPKVINGFLTLLTNVACEWFLIFLMFIDALLSYLLVWFARYCRLQLPCFLCSKFLHPFHWRLLLCRSHRSEVASLMSCQNHDYNLADCRGMCDDCLLSFTKMTGPNPDMNRLLLGKLGYDLLSKSQSKSCSCCNKPWRTRHQSHRLIRLGFRGRKSSGKPNIPTPRSISRRGSSGSLKKMKDHKPISTPPEYVEVGSRSDGMTHVGYKELKIHSDSDSEFLFSDDDAFVHTSDVNIEPSEKHAEDKMSNHKQSDSQDYQDKTFQGDDDQNGEFSMPELDLIDDTQTLPVEEDEHSKDESRPSSPVFTQEDNAEIAPQNEKEAEASGKSSPTGGEFMSTHSTSSDTSSTDCPPGESVASQEIQIQGDDSAVKLEASETAMKQKESDHLAEGDVSGSVENESSYDEEDGLEGDSESLTPNMMSGSTAQDQSSEKETGINENYDTEEYFSNEEEETNGRSNPITPTNVSGSSAEEQSRVEEERTDEDLVAKDHSRTEEEADNGDSEPLTSNNETGSTTEDHSREEDQEVPGEIKPLSSPEIPGEESSVQQPDNGSSKVTEVPSISDGSPELKHSASVESFASISSGIEGESLVNLLKQQLDHDRKCLRDLQKELEEERNASAVATDEAMAMITRLQEEKAALHMEALQYLRMMDEQAEHDVDALEKANDVLADREKEIQDLEMELEYYRIKYPNEPKEEILASMGIIGNIETSVTSTIEDASNKETTDTKVTNSPSPEI